MIYVYDIMLNFSKDVPYEFFEWNNGDRLIHIKRMPLIKINNDSFIKMVKNNICINQELLSKINNLTEVYNDNGIDLLNYAAIFTNGVSSIAIIFDGIGNSIGKSLLLLDEEQETLLLSNKMSEQEITINLLSSNYTIKYETRLEKEIKKTLSKEINDCYKGNNFDKLKYLYFEFFGKEDDSIDKMYQELLNSINGDVDRKHHKLYELLKLSYTNK